MATTKAVADKLVALCREGKNIEAVKTLYAPDVLSVEAAPMQDFPREADGFEAVLGKSLWWYENHEVHSGEALGPYLHGDDRFAVFFRMDVTNKPSGMRFEMAEVGVYTVKDGKISREEFYYTMPG